MSWGKAAYDFMMIELFFFALFAQYYVIVSILIVAAAVALSIWFHFHTETHCKRGSRQKYHNRASAVVYLLLCFVFLIPSFIGMEKEYGSSMTFEEWEEFVDSFKNVPGIVDYDMYSSQPLEADANQYAEERVTAYMEKLNAENE